MGWEGGPHSPFEDAGKQQTEGFTHDNASEEVAAKNKPAFGSLSGERHSANHSSSASRSATPGFKENETSER